MRWYLTEYGPSVEHKSTWYAYDATQGRATKILKPTRRTKSSKATLQKRYSLVVKALEQRAGE